MVDGPVNIKQSHLMEDSLSWTCWVRGIDTCKRHVSEEHLSWTLTYGRYRRSNWNFPGSIWTEKSIWLGHKAWGDSPCKDSWKKTRSWTRQESRDEMLKMTSLLLCLSTSTSESISRPYSSWSLPFTLGLPASTDNPASQNWVVWLTVASFLSIWFCIFLCFREPEARSSTGLRDTQFSLTFHLSVMWCWDNHDLFLGISFLICKVRFIIFRPPYHKEWYSSDEIIDVKLLWKMSRSVAVMSKSYWLILFIVPASFKVHASSAASVETGV